MRAGKVHVESQPPAAVLAGLAELSSEVLCAIDSAGQVRWHNGALARALGREADATVPAAFADLALAEDRTLVAEQLREARATGAVVAWQCRWPGAAEPRRLAWRAHLQPETGLVLAAGQELTPALREQTALRYNERLLQTVFDTIPHPIFVKNRDSRHLMGNAAWGRFSGKPVADLLGLHTLDVDTRSEADRRSAVDLDREFLASADDTLETEYHRTTPDGRERLFHSWRSKLRDENDAVIGLVGIAEDVTAARAQEAALRESERRYRDLVEGSVQGTVILRDRRPLFANMAYARIFGYDSPEEILALDNVDVLATPPDAARQRAYGEARLRGEQVPEQYEFEGVRRDGTHIWLDCIAKVVAWHGEPAIQATIYDITQRRKAEEELRAQQRLLRTIFDTLPHIVFVKDLDGAYMVANRAWNEAHGVTAKPIVGRRSLDIAERPLADRQHGVKLDAEVVRRGELIVSEYPRTRADGSPAMFRNWRTPLRDESGAIVGILGISEDITERRRAEEELRSSQRLLRLLVDALPHNIYVKDAEGRYALVNRAAADYQSLTVEDMVGKRANELPGLDPEHAERLEAMDAQVFATGELCETSGVMVGGTHGRSTLRRILKLPLRDDAGAVEGVVGISEDITERRRAEEDLRSSQRLLRLLIDALPHNIYVKDAEGRFLLANRAMAEHHSMAEAEMLGRSTDQFPAVEKSQAERLQETDREVLEHGRILEWNDVPVNTADGRTTLRRIQKLPLRNDEGEITAIVGISEDITERRRAEEELRASQRLLRTVFDTIPNVLSVKDRDSRFLMVNAAWLKHFGLREDDVVGRHLREVIRVPAAELAQAERLDRMALSGKHAHLEEELVRDLPGGGHDHFIMIRAPLRDDDGGVAGIVAVGVDVTAQRRADEEVRTSRRMLQTVFDVMPMWVYVKDHDRRLVMVNRRMAEDNHTTPEAAVALKRRYLSTGLTPAEQALYEELDLRVLAGEQVELPAGDLTLADGSTRRYRTIRVPLRDANGEITGILGISEDVTDREQTERAMQQAQKMESLGVLAGGIAHDFNNLLVSVLGYAHLAAEELPAQSPAQPLLEHIETAGRRASELCTQMLAYAGKGSFHIGHVQLRDLIGEMTELIRVSVPPTTRLELELPERLPALEVDATQIRQVVMNLVINAAEAIGDTPGVVALRAAAMRLEAGRQAQYVGAPNLPGGTYVLLEISDTGAGMDGETQARIFEPFYSTKFSGRGLGLAAVLGIVRGHGGALRVTSTPGAGTTFGLLLPATEASQDASEQAPAAPKLRGSGLVLVVDDEPFIRELVGTVLERMGFSTELASDGHSAIEAARTHGSALRAAVMDVTMPGMRAEDALRGLLEARPGIAIVLMSGHALTEVRHRFAAFPIAAYLPKPFTGQELQAAVGEALERDQPGANA